MVKFSCTVKLSIMRRNLLRYWIFNHYSSISSTSTITTASYKSQNNQTNPKPKILDMEFNCISNNNLLKFAILRKRCLRSNSS